MVAAPKIRKAPSLSLSFFNNTVLIFKEVKLYNVIYVMGEKCFLTSRLGISIAATLWSASASCFGKRYWFIEKMSLFSDSPESLVFSLPTAIGGMQNNKPVQLYVIWEGCTSIARGLGWHWLSSKGILIPYPCFSIAGYLGVTSMGHFFNTGFLCLFWWFFKRDSWFFAFLRQWWDPGPLLSSWIVYEGCYNLIML